MAMLIVTEDCERERFLKGLEEDVDAYLAESTVLVNRRRGELSNSDGERGPYR